MNHFLLSAALLCGLGPLTQAATTPAIRTTAPTPLTLKPSSQETLDLVCESQTVLSGCHAYLASRPLGSTTWHEETARYRVVRQTPTQLDLVATFEAATASVQAHRIAGGRWKLQGSLQSSSAVPLELARFHYLDGNLAMPKVNLLSMRQYELPGRIVRPDESLKPPRQACEQGWGKSVFWPRLADPIHEQANVAISGDTGILGSDWNQPGCFFGFTGPGTAFGEIGMRTQSNPTTCFVAVLLDACRIEPGQSRPLESLRIAFGDPQDELCEWATSTQAELAPHHAPKPPITGYCSWYQLGQRVEPADLRRALTTFASFPAPPGGRLIQLDDGFQVMPGDWSGRGAWRAELPTFPAEIRAKGFIPGIWIAPTAIHESHAISREHPDWLQRDSQGNPCIAFPNWGGKTYFLDPDHPEARKWIHHCLLDLRKQGWEYFKIDFAYTVSSNRKPFLPHKTTFETLRDQWRLFREALGPDAIINSCNGGIWRYTLGAVDLSRLGGDIGSKPSQLRRNLAEMLLRSHVNQRWFVADPDVFYLRREHSQLTFEQSKLLADTQGMLGLAWLTSDFADQWDEAARAVAQRYWNPQGPKMPTAKRILFNPEGLPTSILLAYADGSYAALLYNWSEHSANTQFDLSGLLPSPKLPLTASAAFGDPEKIEIKHQVVTVHQQPGESVRVVKLTPR